MDWSNEEYVRVYKRDTDDWVCMPWQSRCVMPLLMRKMDRSGVFETKRGAAGVAALISVPLDVVEEGLLGLLADGCLKPHSRGYVMPNFLDAQEANKSDKLRAKESRRRRRDDGPDQNVTFCDAGVTNRDETSRAVTSGHAESHGVTERHASYASSASSLPPSDQNTHKSDGVTVEGGTVVVREPVPSRDLRLEVINEIWSEYGQAQTRCRNALKGGAGFGVGAIPVGELGANLSARFDDFKAGGDDYAGCRAKLLWLVQVAEVKALRDANMAHMARAFDAGEARYALQETDIAEVARQTPSSMARGHAADRRNRETAPKTSRPADPPRAPSRTLT